MNPYRVPCADLASRVASNEQIPPLPSKTPRLDYIDSFGWESFWKAVDNGQFDARPLAMAPMGVPFA
jgi:hypothetical protein